MVELCRSHRDTFTFTLATFLALSGCNEQPSAEAIGTQRAAAIAGHQLYVVAHPEDDLLFMNPELADSIADGRTVRTVFVTSGDAGQPETWWRYYESLLLRAHAAMAGVSNTWSCGATSLAGKAATLCTLTTRPGVSTVFLRLPDGGLIDLWARAPGAPLWVQPVASVTTVDGAATYTRAELVATLRALMTEFQPELVASHDNTFAYGPDHRDHTATGLFTLEAAHDHLDTFRLRFYRGNTLYQGWVTGIDPAPINLTQAEHDAKCGFVAISSGGTVAPDSLYDRWCWRLAPIADRPPSSGALAQGALCAQAVSPAAAGAAVGLASCAPNASQTFRLRGDRHLEGPGGFCVAADPSSGALRLATCAATSPQVWTLLDNGQVRSTDGRCLTSLGSVLALDYCAADQSTSTYTVLPSQSFELRELGPVEPPVTPTITSPAVVGAGEAGLTAEVPARDGMTYQWSIVNGAITSAGGSGGITSGGRNRITFSAGTAGLLELRVVEVNRAGATSAAGVASVTVAPAAPRTPAISAPSAVTAGTTGHRATVVARPGMSYVWSVSGSGRATSVGGSTEGGVNTLTFDATSEGTLSLHCAESNGSTTSPAATLTLPVVAAPVAPTITAPPIASHGQTGLRASVVARPGMTYTWSVSGGTITSSGGAAGETASGMNAITFSAGFGGTIQLSCVETNLAQVASPAANASIPNQGPTGGAGQLIFVAHPDDDLLFMNPHIEQAIVAGQPTRTVYLTSGDGGGANWQRREEGILRAYAGMAQVANVWTCASATYAGKPVTRCTLNARPSVSTIFVRLGDGRLMALWPTQAGEPFWVNPVSQLATIDGVTSFTRAELLDTLVAMLNELRPTSVKTLDHSRAYGFDHSDHVASGFFALAATQRYTAAQNITLYRGYTVYEGWMPTPAPEPVNLSQAEHDAKVRIMNLYETWPIDPDGLYDQWCWRNYSVPSRTTSSAPLVGGSGACLTVGGSGAAGSAVQLSACTGATTQRWTVRSDGRVQAGNGLCLTAGSIRTAATLQPCVTSEAQLWTLFSNGQLRGAYGVCLQGGGAGSSATTEYCGSDQSQPRFTVPASQRWTP